MIGVAERARFSSASRGIISKDNWTPVKFTFSLAYDVSTAAPGNIRVHVHHFAIAG